MMTAQISADRDGLESKGVTIDTQENILHRTCSGGKTTDRLRTPTANIPASTGPVPVERTTGELFRWSVVPSTDAGSVERRRKK